ncbi:hypothetical protein BJF80_15575 [Serinicoccus sp. CUA-874]|uniref:hypothetical protein n=1 Tax=Serinicoccus sp. CUA-874 TaxID=1517939 RepID=UPI000960FD49|nr:hypothetical protein [Serinicoccus sp. CUA-874]OLT18414.1 hypothetical protein BJF80_15575 [Serinicoccus sp. CUA-874]
MRRPLTPLLAVPALLLAACDSGPEVIEPTADASQAPAGGDDAAVTSGGDDAAASAAPDDAAVTSEIPSDGAEGGEDGQAAADRAKEFLLGLVDADPATCDLMLSFSDPTVPMRDAPEDLELCEAQLPETMSAAVEAQGLGEEGRGILEAMQITGAAVDGDTAVIDEDNYSELFAESMGGSTITLVKIDGDWFVDVDRFLATP